MGMSYLEIEAIVSELKPLLTNAWVQKIYQHNELMLTLAVKGEKGYLLHFSIDPLLSRLHLIEKKYDNPKTPLQFCMALRKFLTGGMIEEIELSDHERIVYLKFRRKEIRFKMIAELTGKKSNLILTNEDNKILFVMGKKSADERLAIGNFYILPPAYITKEVDDVGAGSKPAHALNMTLNNQKAAVYYLKKEQTQESDNSRNMLLAFLRKKIKKLEEKKRKLDQELALFIENEKFLEYGELIKQNLGNIKKGAVEATLFDNDNPCKKVSIKLDPSLNAVENMELFFSKYKKALRGKMKIQSPLIETTEEISECRERINKIETALPENLGNFTPLEKTETIRQKKGQIGEIKNSPHQFLSADKVKILVGKNNIQNDEITFKLAKGNDLWLHAQDSHGGHVILCLDKNKEIPGETLLDGATLAVYYSGLKSAGKGNVIYTRKKYVKKPKGARPGLVTYSQEKFFFIRLEPERVMRLMNGKNKQIL